MGRFWVQRHAQRRKEKTDGERLHQGLEKSFWLVPSFVALFVDSDFDHRISDLLIILLFFLFFNDHELPFAAQNDFRMTFVNLHFSAYLHRFAFQSVQI